jgi:hypothetical protein
VIVHLVLAGLLLLHTATPTQTPPPKTSPQPPPSTDGKKRFGPPAGTPGRSANIYVAIPSEGAAPSADATAAGAVVTAALTKLAVKVLDHNSLLGIAPHIRDTALLMTRPEMLRPLNVDGILLVSLKVAARQEFRSGFGTFKSDPYTVLRSTVTLELISVDGSTRASAVGESESSDRAESARKATELAFANLLAVAEFGERQP